MPGAKVRIWVALGAAALLGLLTSCSSDDNVGAVVEKVPLPKGIVSCQDTYKSDAVVNPKTFGDACADGKDMVVPRPVSLKCSDGKVLYWNQFAWGYENQKMSLIDPEASADEKIPYSQAIKCLSKQTAPQQGDLNKAIDSVSSGG
jgi:hypothetical protein